MYVFTPKDLINSFPPTFPLQAESKAAENPSHSACVGSTAFGVAAVRTLYDENTFAVSGISPCWYSLRGENR